MKNNKLSDRSIDISILEKIEKNIDNRDISIDLTKLDNIPHKTQQKIKGGSKKNSQNNEHTTYKKEWYKKNSKNVKNYNKKYYEKNKEKHKEKMLEMYYEKLKKN
jgi:hypothetical protein